MNYTTRHLIERERELAEVEELLAAAQGSRSRVTLLEGPAGIGKSALLDRARARAGELGFTVLAARGGELEREFGFGVVRQLFEPVLARAAPAERDELMSGAAALAEPVFATRVAEQGVGDASPDAILHGLYWLVVNLAGRTPVLVAIDDAHWADAPSLRFLIYLARRLEGIAGAIMLAIRSGDATTEPDLLRALQLEVAARPIRLLPLSASAVDSVIEGWFEERVSAEFCRMCYEATRGNPFLLTAFLEELRDEGRSPTDVDAATARYFAPERIVAAVLLRVGRLGHSAPALARAAAVLGERADLGQAAAVAGLELGEAAREVDALTDASLLEHGFPLRFVHPIVRTAIYEDIPDGTRSAMHARAARLLADAGAEPEAVALHLLPSLASGDAAVVEELRVAARATLSRGAPETAVGYLRRALAEPPPPEQVPTVMFELGSACVRVGEPDAAKVLGTALARATEPSLRAAIALELGAQVIYEGRMADAVQIMECELDRLGEADPGLAVQLESELLIAGVTTASARKLVRPRFKPARQRLASLSPASARLLLPCLAVDVATDGGSAAEAAELAARALEDGPFGMEAAQWALSGIALHALVAAGRLGPAERAASDAMAAARAAGSAYALSLASVLRAFARLRLGALDQAEADASTGLELVQGGVFHPWAFAILALVQAERGDLAGARAALDRVPVHEAGREASHLDQYVLEATARLQLLEGRPKQALAALRECERFEREFAGRPTVIPVAWRSQAAQAHLALGSDDLARGLASTELEIARAYGAPRPIGVALGILGLVEAGERRIELLAEAVEVLGRAEGRLEHARAVVDLGAALRRAGQRSDARDRLAEGMDLAERCGATALVERARSELRVAGARPRHTALTGRESLTASELRICEMAAAGMTNSEIAQALFVTLRTVEMHLTNAYRKLEIRSRRMLADALAQRTEPALG